MTPDPAIVAGFVATSSPRKRARTPKSAKPYHHGDLGNALLQAAVEVIEQQGVAELRMRDLTRRLGVSHGAPANHFKDRNDLLVALGVQGFERLTAYQRAARDREHPTPMDALNAIGVAYVEFARDNPAHFEVMFQRGLLNTPALAAAAAACFQQLLETIAPVSPARASTATQRERDLTALGSWALVHGLAMLHVQRILPGGAAADVAGITKRVLAAMTQLASATAAPKPKPPRARSVRG
jgi:AcrR family transcriptional regulator